MTLLNAASLPVSDYLRERIRTVPDWPSPGVQFRDITPLLQDPQVFRVLIDAFVHRYMTPALRPDVVAGLDARGFILGAVVAYELNVGFGPIRKSGKLPYRTDKVSYSLEYGEAELEMHRDSLKEGAHVLIVDDLLATGGTAHAAAELVDRQGAHVAAFAFVIELESLGGRAVLEPAPVVSILSYP